ncbi:MAG: NTP transferase domain-containing protein [Candidatus Riflebacteria bacterium]|nr:NTP transferase domain-containing protein [Candidatus Riflebacteria bacterium]
MATLTVRLYASLKDLAGTARIDACGASLRDALADLGRKGGERLRAALFDDEGGVREGYQLLLRQEYLDPAQLDTVAIEDGETLHLMMGSPKALLHYEGRPFLSVILDRMARVPVSRCLVVLGRHAAEITAAIDLRSAQVVVNPDPDRGQLSSLQEGVKALLEAGRPMPAALVALVDQPAVTGATYRALASAWQGGAGRGIYLARCGGKHAHPLILSADDLEAALELPATAQMRAVVKRPGAAVVDVEVEDRTVLDDVDTPDDYARLVAGGDR